LLPQLALALALLVLHQQVLAVQVLLKQPVPELLALERVALELALSHRRLLAAAGWVDLLAAPQSPAGWVELLGAPPRPAGAQGSGALGRDPKSAPAAWWR